MFLTDWGYAEAADPRATLGGPLAQQEGNHDSMRSCMSTLQTVSGT